MVLAALSAMLVGALGAHDSSIAPPATATPAPTQAPSLFDASPVKLAGDYAIEVVVSNLRMRTTAGWACMAST
jgi:hypothetical protein